MILAIQAALDVASYIIADEGWPVAATLAESFVRLDEHQAMPMPGRTAAPRFAAAENLPGSENLPGLSAGGTGGEDRRARNYLVLRTPRRGAGSWYGDC